MPLRESYCSVLGTEPERLYDEPQCEKGTWGEEEIEGDVMYRKFLEGYDTVAGDYPLSGEDRRLLNTPFSIYGLSKLLDEVIAVIAVRLCIQGLGFLCL